MALVTRGRGNRFAHLEDMNSRKEPLAAYQAHLEAQFCELEETKCTLTKQLSIGGGRNRCRHIPSSHESEEEDAHVEDEDGSPFVERGVHGCQPLLQAQANRWEFSFKFNIPEFNGGLQLEEFLDWIATVEEVLNFKGVPKDRRVFLVATKF